MSCSSASTAAFDRVYAALLPDPTFASRNASGSPQSCLDSYPFEPASQVLSFPPSDRACMSQWPRDYLWRQTLSLYLITCIFGSLIYFACASFSYVFIFDKATFAHPKFLNNQIRQEIAQALRSIPLMAILTTPVIVLEVRGYSKMYDSSAEGPGAWYDYAQFPLFICFTDASIYWIHRYLHHPAIYKRSHRNDRPKGWKNTVVQWEPRDIINRESKESTN